MLDNQQASAPICPRWQAISLILANDPELLSLLFRKDGQSLRAEPSEVLGWVRGHSSGQRLLVQIVLDIWPDDGGARLWDIISVLDPVRFEGFMLALECLRYGREPQAHYTPN
jgi:hypothetical protein